MDKRLEHLWHGKYRQNYERRSLNRQYNTIQLSQREEADSVCFCTYLHMSIKCGLSIVERKLQSIKNTALACFLFTSVCSSSPPPLGGQNAGLCHAYNVGVCTVIHVLQKRSNKRCRCSCVCGPKKRQKRGKVSWKV